MKIKLDTGAQIPTKKNEGDAGYDLYSLEGVTILPGQRVPVKTGVYLEIPLGIVGLIWPRSGLALNHGINTLAGVIDSTYRGEIVVILHNTGEDIFTCKQGSKVAQIVFHTYYNFDFEQVDTLDETERGNKGFGSSGL